ncbi:hypothetical protein [Actinomyces viscosus]|uniref:hypothetical protein n=1 Tax=Actinomyces viscosus TaxID=1656 RepID=UPI0028EAA9B4|nr:hypothetical protein [Actinomyces viscosus]
MKTVIVLNKDTREAGAFVESYRRAGADPTAPVQRVEMNGLDGDHRDDDVVLPDRPLGADSRFVVVEANSSGPQPDAVCRRYLPLGAPDPQWLGWGLHGDLAELWYAAEGYAIELRARRCFEYRTHEPLDDRADYLFDLDAGYRARGSVARWFCDGLRLASPYAGGVKPLEPLAGPTAGADPVDPMDLHAVCVRHSRVKSCVGRLVPEVDAAAFLPWLGLCFDHRGFYPSEVGAVVCHERGLSAERTPWYRQAVALGAGAPDWGAARLMARLAVAALARRDRPEGGE